MANDREIYSNAIKICFKVLVRDEKGVSGTAD